MDPRTAILSRMFIVLGLILLIPTALGFQLIRINYFEGDELRTLWSKQAIDQIPFPHNVETFTMQTEHCWPPTLWITNWPSIPKLL